jgi:hypothetical protein
MTAIPLSYHRVLRWSLKHRGMAELVLLLGPDAGADNAFLGGCSGNRLWLFLLRLLCLAVTALFALGHGLSPTSIRLLAGTIAEPDRQGMIEGGPGGVNQAVWGWDMEMVPGQDVT